MDFFARQEAARRQSRWLLVAYAIAVLCVIGGIDVIAVLLFATSVETGEGGADSASLIGLVTACSLLVGGVILVSTLYKMLVLRGGGGVVARNLGGVRVDPATQEPLRRRLVNVVEEMAIASGVPAPEVYVLEQETSINAFSAGYAPGNAAVAVTDGMLQRLNREQLQGVIAHEFSHILNGDMRLSVKLLGLNFGLFVLALAGRFMLRASSAGSSGRKGKGAGGLALLAIGVILIGLLGQLCGRLLQAMISRRREHLADASAVQFTRNPEGLKAALVRAAAQSSATRLQAVDGEEVAHMLFLASGTRLFATHPPIIDRLRELEPGYSKERLRGEIVTLQRNWDNEREAAEDAQREESARVRNGVPGLPGLGGGVAGVLSAAAVADSIADPQPQHVQRAQQLHAAQPEELRALAGSPASARAFVLALLLADEGDTRQRQLELLGADDGGAAVAAQALALAGLASGIDAAQRLPAVLQLFPALRRLPQLEQRALMLAIAKLSAADRHIDVFEFALGKVVACSLEEALRPRAPHGSATLASRQQQIALLFAVLARHGAPDDVLAQRAYAAGIGRVLGSSWPDFTCPEDWSGPLSEALDELRDLQPRAKEPLIEGLVATIGHDGEVRLAEAELLRAVCAVLQCPLPPLSG